MYAAIITHLNGHIVAAQAACHLTFNQFMFKVSSTIYVCQKIAKLIHKSLLQVIHYNDRTKELTRLLLQKVCVSLVCYTQLQVHISL